MTNALLHIGAGKCGSSALQTAFSQNPVVRSGREPVQYVAIRQGGELYHGDSLTAALEVSPFGYIASTSGEGLAGFSGAQRRTIAKRLAELGGPDGRIVLSHEGWINDAELFQEAGLLPALGLRCDVIVYVRPPVDWLNSGWWQWGAWTRAPFARWINNTIPRMRWMDRIDQWKGVEGVDRVIVRLLPKDIVADFCGILGVPPVPTNRSNTSLSGTVLRLYQNHRELRPGPHDSSMDFVLGRWLKADEPTPWVMKPQLIKKVIAATREANERLCEALDEASRTQMRADPRWWDAEAYAGRPAEAAREELIATEKLEQLAVNAMHAIKEMDEEIRRLRGLVKTPQ